MIYPHGEPGSVLTLNEEEDERRREQTQPDTIATSGNEETTRQSVSRQ